MEAGFNLNLFIQYFLQLGVSSDVLDSPSFGSGFFFGDWNYKPVDLPEIQEIWEQLVSAKKKKNKLLVSYRTVGGKKKLCPKVFPVAKECEDISMSLLDAASDHNTIRYLDTTGARGDLLGMAMGMIFYTAKWKREHRYSGRHCINWFCDAPYSIRFFEPQIGEEVFLIKEEKKSIDFVFANG